jgi:hypothetical protein
MTNGRFLGGLLGLLLLLTVGAAAPVPKSDPKKDEAGENKNTLVEKYRAKLAVTASSACQGYPPEMALDGKKETSWYSALGESAALGKKPWLMVTFPEDVTVNRLTVLGNRDPNYPIGYSILTGLAEFLDADGKVLWKEECDAIGDKKDFEFKPKEVIKRIRAVRFTSLKDEGDQNSSQDIAVAEILIE